MLNIVFKTFILYIFIIISYRIMGKKEVGNLSIVDLIVSILIAELAAICIEEEKESILISIIPIIELVVIQIFLSLITLKNEKIRKIIDGSPSLIISEGSINIKEMKRIRYTLDDLLSQLREQGISGIKDVKYAVLENNGKLSVFKTSDYPFALIVDGVLDKKTLSFINKDIKWVLKEIEGININNIFYAFYIDNKLDIILK